MSGRKADSIGEELPTLAFTQVSQAPSESQYDGPARPTWKCACCFVENPLSARSCGMCTQERATPPLPARQLEASPLEAAPASTAAAPSSALSSSVSAVFSAHPPRRARPPPAPEDPHAPSRPLPSPSPPVSAPGDATVAFSSTLGPAADAASTDVLSLPVDLGALDFSADPAESSLSPPLRRSGAGHPRMLLERSELLEQKELLEGKDLLERMERLERTDLLHGDDARDPSLLPPLLGLLAHSSSSSSSLPPPPQQQQLHETVPEPASPRSAGGTPNSSPRRRAAGPEESARMRELARSRKQLRVAPQLAVEEARRPLVSVAPLPAALANVVEDIEEVESQRARGIAEAVQSRSHSSSPQPRTESMLLKEPARLDYDTESGGETEEYPPLRRVRESRALPTGALHGRLRRASVSTTASTDSLVSQAPNGCPACGSKEGVTALWLVGDDGSSVCAVCGFVAAMRRDRDRAASPTATPESSRSQQDPAADAAGGMEVEAASESLDSADYFADPPMSPVVMQPATRRPSRPPRAPPRLEARLRTSDSAPGSVEEPESLEEPQRPARKRKRPEPQPPSRRERKPNPRYMETAASSAELDSDAEQEESPEKEEVQYAAGKGNDNDDGDDDGGDNNAARAQKSSRRLDGSHQRSVVLGESDALPEYCWRRLMRDGAFRNHIDALRSSKGHGRVTSGKRVVLTGTFEPGQRSLLVQAVSLTGGAVCSAVESPSLRGQSATTNEKSLEEWMQKSRQIVLAPAPATTAKFLLALVRCVPILHTNWLVHSVKVQSPLPYHWYLLSASAEGGQPPQRPRSRVFQGKRIEIVGVAEFRRDWKEILTAAGAQVVERLDRFLSFDSRGQNVVVQPSDGARFCIDVLLSDAFPNDHYFNYFELLPVPVVTADWAIRSIVADELVDPATCSPKFGK